MISKLTENHNEAGGLDVSLKGRCNVTAAFENAGYTTTDTITLPIMTFLLDSWAMKWTLLMAACVISQQQINCAELKLTLLIPHVSGCYLNLIMFSQQIYKNTIFL